MTGLERYEKIKNLGEGAQGNVILSKDTLLGRKVAIKSLHQSLISDALHVKRFEEEAKTLANFRHDNIINVYDIIVNSDGCHLVMEYFEGYPLNQYIKNITGPIPENKAVDIFIMILDAMSYIHKKNIIHRDIKPSNIMINDNSDIRLLDFGIAKNTENDAMLTQIGGSAGYTPMYMSPEHCNGTKITKYSDIYSLGVTLWQILTGKAPYEGFTQGQIYLKVANESLPSIQSVYQNVSLKMNEIVQKATHKDPNKRYSSCEDFKKELLKLKEHINEHETEFIYSLSIEILNEKEAKIYFNEDQHYGTEFSKSFNHGSAVELKVIKEGYKDIKQNIIITKNETLQFSLEKQKLSVSTIISEIQKKLIPHIYNIKPNLLNLLGFLKLNIIWTIETIKLKLHKDQTETVKIAQKKRNETKKEIDKSFEFIKIHKKEYATYLVILGLFIISILSILAGGKKDAGANTKYPLVNFKNNESEDMESQTSVKIPIELSQVSDSTIKIPLLFSGTATGDDFINKSDTLVIQPNQKIGFIELWISDDKVFELDETIIIELQNNTNFNIGEKQNYTYTIINDDEEPIKKKKKKKKKKTATTNVDPVQTPIQTINTESAYQRIRRNNTHDKYSGKFGGKYFLLIKENGDENYLTIFDYNTGKKIGPEYEIKGNKIIKNIHYKNHRLYTNKGAKSSQRAHLIDIRNPSSSKYKGLKIRKGYLGPGGESELTLNRK